MRVSIRSATPDRAVVRRGRSYFAVTLAHDGAVVHRADRRGMVRDYSPVGEGAGIPEAIARLERDGPVFMGERKRRYPPDWT